MRLVSQRARLSYLPLTLHRQRHQETYPDRQGSPVSSVHEELWTSSHVPHRYHFYAELIIASFGLNQALERESETLVAAFVHVSRRLPDTERDP